ncbi:MAG: hypothetical protein ACRBBP_07000 [Bdellovibrionales bacterium]
MLLLLTNLFFYTFLHASVEQIQKPAGLNHPPQYSNHITIDVHIPSATSIKKSDVFKEIKLAQEIWAQCEIGIKIRNIFKSDLKPEISLDFETIAFNSWRISEFEQEIFDNYSFGVPTVHYVEFLDWSYDKSGTRAISYPPFLDHSLNKVHKDDQLFYKSKMQGSNILSSLRDTSTLAHEIGHSIFDLRHSDLSKNLMIGSVSGKRRHFRLSKDQCSKAKQATR